MVPTPPPRSKDMDHDTPGLWRLACDIAFDVTVGIDEAGAAAVVEYGKVSRGSNPSSSNRAACRAAWKSKVIVEREKSRGGWVGEGLVAGR